MNISIISGSARSNNNTIRVGYALKKIFEQAGHQTSLVDFMQYDIPLINQGELDPNELSTFQQSLVTSIENADLCIIITPEYNWSTTPEILNFLHRFGDKKFASIFDEKVFALVGVSTGKGGKAPALHLVSILNKIISFLDLNSVVSPKLFESHFTKEVIDERGNLLGNALFDKGINDFVDYNIRVTKRWKIN
jgi:chromate reductase, NAD(P)H dehydrogenase (quinone)